MNVTSQLVRLINLMTLNSHVVVRVQTMESLQTNFANKYTGELRNMAAAAEISLEDAIVYNLFIESYLSSMSIMSQSMNGQNFHSYSAGINPHM